MRSYLVLLEGTPASWEAAYSAIHLAARLASRLVGVAGMESGSERKVRQWLAEFETGGRAAGIAVESRLLARLEPDLVLAQTEINDGVFIGRQGDEPLEMLNALYDRLPSPLWVVPRQVSVRRMAYLAGREGDDGTSRFAHSLSRRLGVGLSALPPEAGPDRGGAPSVDAVAQRLVNAHSDLVVFGRSEEPWPAHALCTQPPCLVACLPS